MLGTMPLGAAYPAQYFWLLSGTLPTPIEGVFTGDLAGGSVFEGELSGGSVYNGELMGGSLFSGKITGGKA